jgi:hypothetical protein
MGIDISGGMFVGKWAKDAALTEEGEEMIEIGEIDYVSPWYDADREDCFIGIGIKDYRIDQLEFLIKEVEGISKKLTPILGEGIMLVGMQDVT